ncbi:hypothetical protein RXV88_16280, partial [Aestuariicoccus sp. MJ-SS9]|nr:hypothetical protein [Aestuariicoccus sp. MJ-SS9]
MFRYKRYPHSAKAEKAEDEQHNDHEADDGRCCKSLSAKDSLRESMPLDALYEQAITRPLSHHELVQLQRIVARAG